MDLTIDTSETLQTMIEQGRLEMAVLAGPIASTRLSTEPVGPIHNIWVASPRLGLPAGCCAAGVLAEHPIISDRVGSRLHAVVLGWFRAEGVEPHRHHSASNLHTRLYLAEAGLGVALVAYSTAMRAVRRGALVAVQTARRAPHLDYVLACADASLSPPAHYVATAARALIKQQPDLDAYFAAASIADR
jgi:DNA-binding transcriptional LysR family regulator